MATSEATMTAPRSWGLKRAIGLLLKAVVAVVTGVAIATVAGASLPSLFGFHPMVVTGGSMAPSIDAGDLVLLRDVPAERIGEGDVVTFRQHDGAGMTTHRVIEVKEMADGTYLQTGGDANELPDADLTPADAVYGEVAMRVPRVGPVLLFAATPVGKLVLLGVPAVLLLLTEIGGFRSALRARRARDSVRGPIPPPTTAPPPVTRPAVPAPTFAFSAKAAPAFRSPAASPAVATFFFS